MTKTTIPSKGPRHKLLWQLPYLRPRSLESWRYRVWYCWARAQGHDTRTVIHAGPFGSLPSLEQRGPWHWMQTVARFLWLSAVYAYRSLPVLWCLIRYGPFMMVQRRQWTGFEGRALDSWPEIKRKVIEYHYSR
jgi:hypothetical protein